MGVYRSVGKWEAYIWEAWEGLNMIKLQGKNFNTDLPN